MHTLGPFTFRPRRDDVLHVEHADGDLHVVAEFDVRPARLYTHLRLALRGRTVTLTGDIDDSPQVVRACELLAEKAAGLGTEAGPILIDARRLRVHVGGERSWSAVACRRLREYALLYAPSSLAQSLQFDDRYDHPHSRFPETDDEARPLMVDAYGTYEPPVIGTPVGTPTDEAAVRFDSELKRCLAGEDGRRYLRGLLADAEAAGLPAGDDAALLRLLKDIRSHRERTAERYGRRQEVIHRRLGLKRPPVGRTAVVAERVAGVWPAFQDEDGEGRPTWEVRFAVMPMIDTYMAVKRLSNDPWSRAFILVGDGGSYPVCRYFTMTEMLVRGAATDADPVARVRAAHGQSDDDGVPLLVGLMIAAAMMREEATGADAAGPV